MRRSSRTGRGVRWQAHPEQDRGGVLQTDLDHALAGVGGPSAGRRVDERDADAHEALDLEAAEQRGRGRGVAARREQRRALHDAVYEVAEDTPDALALLLGEPVHQVLAGGCGRDDEVLERGCRGRRGRGSGRGRRRAWGRSRSRSR